MALEALVNDLKDIFANTFKANLVHVNLNAMNSSQPIYVMGGFNPVGFSHSAGIEYHLEICVEEADAKFRDSSCAAPVMFTIRNEIFNKLIEGCAVVQASRVDRDYRSSGFRTTVNLVVFDIDKFSENVKDFSWNIYSNEFNQLMDKTLKD